MALFNSDNHVEQKYNEVYYDVDLYLDNSGDFNNPRRYHINPAAVLNLSISDTANDWIVDGFLSFMYLPEEIEKTTTGQTASTFTGTELAAAENGKMLQNYQFRNDGYDLLRVMIVPKKPTPLGPNDIDVDSNNMKWMLSYVFSIYDIEDVNDVSTLQGNSSGLIKCLKLKFHDIRYQMLRTANIEYSTSIPKDQTLTPNFNSEIAKTQGVLHTGDILRDIFNEVLANPNNGGCEEFKIEAGPRWDIGKSELFYTSPAQSTAAEDIDYIYSHHVSTKALEGAPADVELNDMCLLHTDRPKAYGEIEPLVLTPVTDLFEKAGKDSASPGELQKEHFFVTDLTEETLPTNLYKSPIGGNDVDVDLKTSKFGQIISYSFVDMSASINSERFRTTPVYSVDIKNRQFNIEFKGNDIKNIKNVISKSYISKLYKNAKDEDCFLPVLHKNKKDLNLFPTFSLNGNNAIVRQKNGLHDLLYTGLFQNACICFNTLGLTLRESGTFIGIDKTDGSPNTDFSNKLYGQWFVVRVDHIFEAGAYMNVIYAVKLHRHSILKTKFEGLLENNII